MAVFSWAEFRQTKGAIKLHVGLDHDGLLPKFVTVMDGKTADITAGRAIYFPKGIIVVCDRGYTDYQWCKYLTGKGVFFGCQHQLKIDSPALNFGLWWPLISFCLLIDDFLLWLVWCGNGWVSPLHDSRAIFLVAPLPAEFDTRPSLPRMGLGW